MSSITRWVLAHKRTVILFWLVLTVVGIASADSATKAMDQKFSVPGKEGWETNMAIADRFGGTGGDSAPIVPVVTLPSSKTVDSPGVRAQLGAGRPAASARPARVTACLLRFDRGPQLRLYRRPDDVRDRLPEARPQRVVRGEPGRSEDRQVGRSRLPRGRRSRSRERLRRAPERQRRRQRHRRAARGACSAASAR